MLKVGDLLIYKKDRKVIYVVIGVEGLSISYAPVTASARTELSMHVGTFCLVDMEDTLSKWWKVIEGNLLSRILC